MGWRAFAIGTGIAALALVLGTSCQTPTEITVVVSTDVGCDVLRGTTVTVGLLGAIETKPPTTRSTSCDPSGNLGSLVIVPSGGRGDELAFKVVAGRGRDAESCVPPYGKGCIVARRALRFLPHAGLRIEVPLRGVCDGISCGDTETCVAGSCVTATIADPGACAGGSCGESALVPPGDAGASDAAPPADAGATDASVPDAAPGTTVYNDVTNAAFWSSFNLTTVNAPQFASAVFDGRYVYYIPTYDCCKIAPVTRYDTQGAFGAAASWTTFDVTTVNAQAKGFLGGGFDGRYVYLTPEINDTGFDGLLARYDTQAPFTSAASWSTFDLTTVTSTAKGLLGSIFDGRYLYLVPSGQRTAARFDTQAPFTSASSYLTADMLTVAPNETGALGGAFDGRYVYFAPSGNPKFVGRYDTTLSFTAAASWSTFDVGVVTPGNGYYGAVYDGRFVYFCPFSSGPISRYDTQAAFTVAASWSTFDTTTINALATGYYGGTFDGRYVYFAPGQDLVTRYDTQGAFASASGWSIFDLKGLLGSASHYFGATFDGRYMYLVPTGSSVFVRFDSKSPPSLPPGSGASFL